MHHQNEIENLTKQFAQLTSVRPVGRVIHVGAGVIRVSGLGQDARLGDVMRITPIGQTPLTGEVIQLEGDAAVILPEAVPDGVALSDRAVLLPPIQIAPCDAWIGRVIDPSGNSLDGKPLAKGLHQRPLRALPPPAATRRTLGNRINTGLAVMNTMLPIVSGQRMGLFAGSGVGKSSLLGTLAQQMQADVVVIALIGERGRELRHFLDDVLGEEGQKRAVVVAATSDQSALQRRRCALTAMATAEHFRDTGKSVLLLADSITRFAEAHREIAVAAGEAPVLRGFPASTTHQIMSLCERAGPGPEGKGDITAVFSVLVAGSDMEEPIADILRGVLDGHIVLDRSIAERGRYPAIDVLQSVSRSLPKAASISENEVILKVRKTLNDYDSNALMIRAGLYAHGSDPAIDQAITLWPALDAFMGKPERQDIKNSFDQLALILRRNAGSAKSPRTVE